MAPPDRKVPNPGDNAGHPQEISAPVEQPTPRFDVNPSHGGFNSDFKRAQDDVPVTQQSKAESVLFPSIHEMAITGLDTKGAQTGADKDASSNAASGSVDSSTIAAAAVAAVGTGNLGFIGGTSALAGMEQGKPEAAGKIESGAKANPILSDMLGGHAAAKPESEGAAARQQAQHLEAGSVPGGKQAGSDNAAAAGEAEQTQASHREPNRHGQQMGENNPERKPHEAPVHHTQETGSQPKGKEAPLPASEPQARNLETPGANAERKPQEAPVHHTQEAGSQPQGKEAPLPAGEPQARNLEAPGANAERKPQEAPVHHTQEAGSQPKGKEAPLPASEPQARNLEAPPQPKAKESPAPSEDSQAQPKDKPQPVQSQDHTNIQPEGGVDNHAQPPQPESRPNATRVAGTPEAANTASPAPTNSNGESRTAASPPVKDSHEPNLQKSAQSESAEAATPVVSQPSSQPVRDRAETPAPTHPAAPGSVTPGESGTLHPAAPGTATPGESHVLHQAIEPSKDKKVPAASESPAGVDSINRNLQHNTQAENPTGGTGQNNAQNVLQSTVQRPEPQAVRPGQSAPEHQANLPQSAPEVRNAQAAPVKVETPKGPEPTGAVSSRQNEQHSAPATNVSPEHRTGEVTPAGQNPNAISPPAGASNRPVEGGNRQIEGANQQLQAPSRIADGTQNHAPGSSLDQGHRTATAAINDGAANPGQRNFESNGSQSQSHLLKGGVEVAVANGQQSNTAVGLKSAEGTVAAGASGQGHGGHAVEATASNVGQHAAGRNSEVSKSADVAAVNGKPEAATAGGTIAQLPSTKDSSIDNMHGGKPRWWQHQQLIGPGSFVGDQTSTANAAAMLASNGVHFAPKDAALLKDSGKESATTATGISAVSGKEATNVGNSTVDHAAVPSSDRATVATTDRNNAPQVTKDGSINASTAPSQVSSTREGVPAAKDCGTSANSPVRDSQPVVVSGQSKDQTAGRDAGRTVESPTNSNKDGSNRPVQQPIDVSSTKSSPSETTATRSSHGEHTTELPTSPETTKSAPNPNHGGSSVVITVVEPSNKNGPKSGESASTKNDGAAVQQNGNGNPILGPTTGTANGAGHAQQDPNAAANGTANIDPNNPNTGLPLGPINLPGLQIGGQDPNQQQNDPSAQNNQVAQVPPAAGNVQVTATGVAIETPSGQWVNVPGGQLIPTPAGTYVVESPNGIWVENSQGNYIQIAGGHLANNEGTVIAAPSGTWVETPTGQWVPLADTTPASDPTPYYPQPVDWQPSYPSAYTEPNIFGMPVSFGGSDFGVSLDNGQPTINIPIALGGNSDPASTQTYTPPQAQADVAPALVDNSTPSYTNDPYTTPSQPWTADAQPYVSSYTPAPIDVQPVSNNLIDNVTNEIPQTFDSFQQPDQVPDVQDGIPQPEYSADQPGDWFNSVSEPDPSAPLVAEQPLAPIQQPFAPIQQPFAPMQQPLGDMLGDILNQIFQEDQQPQNNPPALPQYPNEQQPETDPQTTDGSTPLVGSVELDQPVSQASDNCQNEQQAPSGDSGSADAVPEQQQAPAADTDSTYVADGDNRIETNYVSASADEGEQNIWQTATIEAPIDRAADWFEQELDRREEQDRRHHEEDVQRHKLEEECRRQEKMQQEIEEQERRIRDLLLAEVATRKPQPVGTTEARLKYVVKESDTLQSIAQRKLGDRHLGLLIYNINKTTIKLKVVSGKRVPELKTGMIIYLPTTTDIRQFRTTMSFVQQPDATVSAIAAATPASPQAQARRQTIEILLGKLTRSSEEDSCSKYYVRLGDTLRSIAVKHPALGDVSLWKLLAEVNGLSTRTDDKGAPVVTLKRGTVLVIPSEEQISYARTRGLEPMLTA